MEELTCARISGATPSSSPGLSPARESIYKDLLIVGGRNPETLPAPPGDIRAYDVRTGALRWSFHTIPHPGEFGYDTWPKDAWKTSGAANNWAGMAVDPERGIVYAPTGSAAPDFYGITRIGDDLFANTLLALDAATGKRIWHFQAVHHDMWDRDLPSPPILVSVQRDGKKIPAVAQTSKQGYLFVFDRETGAPLFPIENRPALPSTTPGEVASPTQPYPLAPEPFARQNITENDLTNRTPEAHEWAVKRLREIRHEGQFVPLSVGKDTLVDPSFEGGAEWGGPAFDPETDVLYVNANNYASMGALAFDSGGSPGQTVYLAQCSICHGEHRQGSAEFPSLLNITQRLTVGTDCRDHPQWQGAHACFAVGRQRNEGLARLSGDRKRFPIGRCGKRRTMAKNRTPRRRNLRRPRSCRSSGLPGQLRCLPRR